MAAGAWAFRRSDPTETRANGGQRFDAIFFRRTEDLPAKVRLAYRPVINEFMGRRSVQLVIEAAEA